MPNLRQRGKHSEEGYILITVLFLVALVLIGLAVAAPRMAQSIQRDKEIELVHRGEQYKRAIKLYYRKFGAYPTSINQLLSTNNIRFLRKRYTDPITGKDDWRLIHLGQAKVPPMGFFGQPLAGIPGAGAGAANIGTPASAMAAGAAGAAGATSPFGGGATGENTFSNSSATNTGTASTPFGSTPAPATPGGTGTASTGFGSSATSSNGSASSPVGGIGPIVGVGIPSTKPSLLAYKKQTHYNKWEFVYNPIEDQMQQAGMMGAGNGSGNGTNGTNGTSGTTSSSPFGSNDTNSSPFGSSTTNSSPFGSNPSPFGSSTGSSTSGTTSPTTSNPQQ
ncbi:MAG: type II secretion system protein [Acidobacteriaceae bacterium]